MSYIYVVIDMGAYVSLHPHVHIFAFLSPIYTLLHKKALIWKFTKCWSCDCVTCCKLVDLLLLASGSMSEHELSISDTVPNPFLIPHLHVFTLIWIQAVEVPRNIDRQYIPVMPQAQIDGSQTKSLVPNLTVKFYTLRIKGTVCKFYISCLTLPTERCHRNWFTIKITAYLSSVQYKRLQIPLLTTSSGVLPDTSEQWPLQMC